MGSAGTSALVTIEIDASKLGRRSDGIRELFDRELVAIVVKQVFPVDTMAAAVERLCSGRVDVPVIHVPVFRGPVLGRPLVASGEDFGRYLADAKRFREAAPSIFGEDERVEERIQEIIGGLAGGRPASVPQANGQPYLPATIRGLLEGDRLPLHFENSTFDNPVMKGLNPSLNRRTLLSFYVPMAMPSGGGELRIYAGDCMGEGSSLIKRMGSDDAARIHLEAQWNAVLHPGIGDMLIFDGGRHYHEVTPVLGSPRWTMGGFIAVSSDHRQVYYWS